MGKKKTTLLTDIGLSQEIMFRDEAFKRILENDLKFPNFPWINLENELKLAFEFHQVYNLASVRRFVRKKRKATVFCYAFLFLRGNGITFFCP